MRAVFAEALSKYKVCRPGDLQLAIVQAGRYRCHPEHVPMPHLPIPAPSLRRRRRPVHLRAPHRATVRLFLSTTAVLRPPGGA